ncbi:hypothetical protein [Sorangium sp. So ce1078]
MVQREHAVRAPARLRVMVLDTYRCALIPPLDPLFHCVARKQASVDAAT